MRLCYILHLQHVLSRRISMNGWYSVWEVQPFARALHSTNASPKTVPQGRFTDQPVRRLHFNYITHVGDKTLKLILRKFIGIGSPCSAARQLPWDPTVPWVVARGISHALPWMPMDAHGRPRGMPWAPTGDRVGCRGSPWASMGSAMGSHRNVK